MNKNNMIAIIVEGAKREIGIFNNLQANFFQNNNIVILDLPAEMNIYMLWKEIEENAGDVDVIEVIREKSKIARKKLEGFFRKQFAEIYLFFDYDYHQKNIGARDGMTAEEILTRMFEVFNNETENGKLYISYPMCEAIRDFISNDCRAFSGKCMISVDDCNHYKNASGTSNPMGHIKKYGKSEWNMVIDCFKSRVGCMTGMNRKLTIQECKQQEPELIYQLQEASMNEIHQFWILSAFPEFLIDYFKEDELIKALRY